MKAGVDLKRVLRSWRPADAVEEEKFAVALAEAQGVTKEAAQKAVKEALAGLPPLPEPREPVTVADLPAADDGVDFAADFEEPPRGRPPSMNDNDLLADLPDAIEKQRAAIGPEQPARDFGDRGAEPDLLDDPEPDILDDADFGDGAAPVRVVPLSISDEQLARDLITHFTEIEESGVIHVPATGQTLFAEPHSGLWRRY